MKRGVLIILLFSLIFISLIGIVSGEIELDKVSSASNSHTNSLTFQHTIGNGNNRVLIVGFGAGYEGKIPSDVIINVTYNNILLTKAISRINNITDNSVLTEIWYLPQSSLPSAGTYTIVINLKSSPRAFSAGAISLNNVSQIAPPITASNIGESNIITSITPTGGGAWVVDVVSGRQNDPFNPTESNQIERWEQQAGGVSRVAGSTKEIYPAGATSLGWSGGHNILSHSLVAFNPESLITAPPIPEPPTSICSDEDRIMKLFSSNNSHGALWNFSDYSWDICCSDVFGAGNPACSPTTPHPTSCTNPVVWLNDTYNSHAENPNINSYQYPVCYGDLICRAVTDPTNCAADENITVRLYQNNNSHISNASDTSYPIKICCKSGFVAPPPVVENVYWANMLGEKINTAQIGDTVLMIYNKSSGNYNYTIWEDDLFENNTWFDDRIRTISNSFSFQGKIAAKWTITQADYDRGNSLEDMEFLNNNHEEFYFNVDGKTSTNLIVNQSSYNNSFPYTDIIKPVNGANYTINAATGLTGNINFEQISSDEDDDLKILWSFGDGTNSIWLENCLTTGNCNTTHSYSNSGYKIIRLTAKEIGRIVPQTALDYAGVYVYKNGTNVFAVITKPEFGKPVSGRFIQIDAHNSFAAECDLTCPSVCSGTCYTITDNLEVNPALQCCNYAKDDKLLFNWSFDDGTSKYGNWSNYNEVVNFTKFFAEAGEHEINLKVGYNKG